MGTPGYDKSSLDEDFDIGTEASMEAMGAVCVRLAQKLFGAFIMKRKLSLTTHLKAKVLGSDEHTLAREKIEDEYTHRFEGMSLGGPMYNNMIMFD